MRDYLQRKLTQRADVPFVNGTCDVIGNAQRTQCGSVRSSEHDAGIEPHLTLVGDAFMVTKRLVR